MKPKPIFVVTFKSDILSKEEYDKCKNDLSIKLNDYHVIVISDNIEQNVKCDLYSITNANNIDIEILKSDITNRINELFNDRQIKQG